MWQPRAYQSRYLAGYQSLHIQPKGVTLQALAAAAAAAIAVALAALAHGIAPAGGAPWHVLAVVVESVQVLVGRVPRAADQGRVGVSGGAGAHVVGAVRVLLELRVLCVLCACEGFCVVRACVRAARLQSRPCLA